MAENLIINGVDHAKFDVEWAKRGGWCIADDSNVNFQQKMLGKMINNTFFSIKMFTKDAWFDINSYGIDRTLRMATPAECEAAGIEYIEPPMMWRDIESAPKNTWVIATDGFYVTEAFFTTSRNAWVMKGCGELSVTHWMTKPQPPKDE